MDAPSEVLAELVRRRGLRYSRAYVRAAVERHPSPDSLLALVDVARSVGLGTSAGRGELDTLDELGPEALPVVLHFESEGASGFGLLEGSAPGGFRIWDSRHGSRAVERGELARLWSGIVVLVDGEVGEGARERRYLLHRLGERLLEEWRFPLDPTAWPVRVALGLVLLPLLVIAILAQPAGALLATVALAALASLGLAASVAALAWTRGGKASRLCGAGMDCGAVLLSPYARVGGVPLAGVGLAFFGSVLLMICTAAFAGPAPVRVAAASFLPALPISVVLLLLQVRMRRFCALCVTVHAVNLAGALTLFALGPWGLPPGALPALALQALLFVLLLVLAVPTLARRDEDEALRRTYHELSRSPLASLAELTLEQALPLDPRAVGIPLGHVSAPHALLVLVHPSCRLCGPFLDELEALLQRHGDDLRAYVGVAPVDPDDATDRALCEALCAVGLAAGGTRFLEAFRLAKRDLARLRTGDPLTTLAAALHLDRTLLDQERERAWWLVHEAAGLKARHVEGIPAVFLDGRRCAAPLRHVDAWLERPPLHALLPRPAAPSVGAVEEGGLEL